MQDTKQQEIIKFIKKNPLLSSKEIHDGLATDMAYATVKRLLSKLIADKLIITKGQGRGSKYLISPAYELFYSIKIDKYFEKDIDERNGKKSFNFSLITDVLSEVSIFTALELAHLNTLQASFKENISELSTLEYNKELERLAIDLSWKSSQIEGNTYSLLETEQLLKEKQSAVGKSKDDTIMLLNHKEAIDFIVEQPNYISPLTLSSIEDIHSILAKNLRIDCNIRKRRVGISGTNYRPLA